MTEVSTTVGSITGEMRLDITQWVRAIDQAKGAARELEGEHASLTIEAENRKALDAIDEVEADAKALEATPARIRVEVDTSAATAKIDELAVRAEKPIVQDVIVRTQDLTGFDSGTLRPSSMGAAPASGQMATEQILGSNGDLVKSYKGVEAEVVSVGMAFTKEEENALSVTVAKLQLTAANKAAAAAEAAYVKVLQDEKASSDAIAAAEQKALTTRHLATQASTELATVERELVKVEQDVTAGAGDAGKGVTNAGNAAAGAKGPMAALGAVLLGLGPMLIPLVDVALGTTAALAGLGATGALAFLGIKAQMAAGTAEGAAYSGMLAGLKADAHELENTAAAGILPGASAAADRLTSALPMLNGEVSMFAGELGHILPTGVDAVVTALDRAQPLLQAAGQGVVGFVQGLDGFAHSSAFESFVQYAIANLPLVGSTMSDLLTFVANFSQAMGPYGSVVLSLVDDALKLGTVLAPVAPGIWAIVTALTALKLTGTSLSTVTGLLAGLGATAEVTAGEVGTVAVAEAVATDGANLIPEAASGAAGVALLAGLGVGVTGLSMASQQPQGTPVPGAGNTPGTSYGGAGTVGTGTGPKFGGGATSYGGYTAAAPASSSGPTMGGGDTSYNGFGGGPVPTPPSPAPVLTLADAYRQLAAAAQMAYTAQQTNAKAAQTLEGTYDTAADSLSKLSKNMATNRTTLDQNTVAGRTNREAILAVVQAADAHAAAINSDGQHAAQAAIYTDTFALSLEKSLTQMGMSKKAADDYIRTLLGMPKNVSLTVALNDARAQAYLASIKSQMNNLNGTAATVYVNAVASGVSTGRAAQIAKNAAMGYATGGTIGLASGGSAFSGTVTGPGNAAADLAGRYSLANGEEVTSNMFGQASTFRPVLKAINGQQVRTMDDLAAMLGAGRRGSLTQKTVNVGGVHLHNPVAKDPVQSAEDASQLIGAYASFPG